MLVSNFYTAREHKPPWLQQVPPKKPPKPTEFTAYELRVTNLSDSAIRFEVEWRTSEIKLSGLLQPKLVRADLHNFFGSWSVSSPVGEFSFLQFRWDYFRGNYYARTGWTVEPNGSALFSLTPSGWPSKPLADKESLAVAGYAELYVPFVRSPEPPYAMIPQAEAPVPVLLDATRHMYAGGNIYTQPDRLSESSVPLATGMAYNEVEPDQPLGLRDAIGVVKYLEHLKTQGLKAPSDGAMELPSEDRAQALIDLLASMSDEPAEIEALNHMLEQLGNRVRVSASNHASSN
ncbi:hypothetical protein [Rhodococcus sp. T7]|uniref:hypothetical protein n=1 Tax=Rhodococcus sp. T7 TaxID=627444 RepID=UPI001358140C|nr:hypothetical protein [Rhodococcus sp. T7]KAF0957350.1 hypothetical protein MLGJGCBP_09181 [Rhodococcus sp. T7]KAF0966730.1 hypothetical protein MLGJGCBP_00104 [Rhodococcus sp. T7]